MCAYTHHTPHTHTYTHTHTHTPHTHTPKRSKTTVSFDAKETVLHVCVCMHACMNVHMLACMHICTYIPEEEQDDFLL
jgi:hypothetical protein